MGTLASELAPHAERMSPRPRVYADANVPARFVAHMRETLGWDVLFVMEEPQLRRASDLRHFRLASQLRRTLITLDNDYLDDRRFPPAEGSGVLVISAPDDRQFIGLLSRIARLLFDAPEQPRRGLPLDGRKLQAHTDWRRDAT
ncbi:MAG: DUF5615 family PIN-like protein [Vicinamibacterales bacterium]